MRALALSTSSGMDTRAPGALDSAGYFSILLELASAVGAPGSHKVVLVPRVQFHQNLPHGRGVHEREPGADAAAGKLFGESTKEELTKRGTESRILWKLHVIGETPAVGLWA